MSFPFSNFKELGKKFWGENDITRGILECLLLFPAEQWESDTCATICDFELTSMRRVTCREVKIGPQDKSAPAGLLRCDQVHIQTKHSFLEVKFPKCPLFCSKIRLSFLRLNLEALLDSHFSTFSSLSICLTKNSTMSYRELKEKIQYLSTSMAFFYVLFCFFYDTCAQNKKIHKRANIYIYILDPFFIVV